LQTKRSDGTARFHGSDLGPSKVETGADPECSVRPGLFQRTMNSSKTVARITQSQLVQFISF
jgi:hypothetical protein